MWCMCTGRVVMGDAASGIIEGVGESAVVSLKWGGGGSSENILRREFGVLKGDYK